MEDNLNPCPADKIEELIRREKEAAERTFENARFETQLFERVRNAEDAGPTTWFVWLRKRGPVVASSALILAIAGFLLFRKPPLSRFQQTVQAMSTVLVDARDGGRSAEEERPAQRIVGAGYTDFGWALKGVLYACERESLGDVELEDALSRIFLEEARQSAPGRVGGKSSFPRMESLKLRSGEDFKMFFTAFLKKFEEV